MLLKTASYYPNAHKIAKILFLLSVLFAERLLNQVNPAILKYLEFRYSYLLTTR